MDLQIDNVDGLGVRYRSYRKVGAPTIVLANPWLLSIRSWDRMWSELIKDYQVLALDLPGFGISAGRKDLVFASKVGEQLDKIFDHFELEDVHLIAPSVSAPSFFWNAVQSPDRVQSIVSLSGPSTSPIASSWDLTSLMRSKGVRRLVAAGGALFVRETLKKGLSEDMLSEDELAEYVRNASRFSAFSHRLNYLHELRDDVKKLDARLEQLDLPVLIIWGDEDPFFPSKNGQYLMNRIPGAKLEQWENCGHYPHLEQPKRFISRLREWVFNEK